MRRGVVAIGIAVLVAAAGIGAAMASAQNDEIGRDDEEVVVPRLELPERQDVALTITVNNEGENPVEVVVDRETVLEVDPRGTAQTTVERPRPSPFNVRVTDARSGDPLFEESGAGAVPLILNVGPGGSSTRVPKALRRGDEQESEYEQPRRRGG